MKQLLISIKPEYVEKILNGEKTIFIKTTMPNKDNLPCEVFILCSKGKKDYHLCKLYKDNKYPYYTYESYNGWGCMPKPMDGKVVAKFILNRVNYLSNTSYLDDTNYLYDKYCSYLEDSCMTAKEIQKYGKAVYAWIVTDLQILDKPFSLSENKLVNPTTCVSIKKAPRSWTCCEYIDDKELPF